MFVRTGDTIVTAGPQVKQGGDCCCFSGIGVSFGEDMPRGIGEGYGSARLGWRAPVLPAGDNSAPSASYDLWHGMPL